MQVNGSDTRHVAKDLRRNVGVWSCESSRDDRTHASTPTAILD